MTTHIIIDFSYLYYKYKFQREYGRIRELTAEVDGNSLDITNIYYPLKEVEAFRKQVESSNNRCKISICFDSKSFRKELETGGENVYKQNRTSKLNTTDFDNLDIIHEILSDAGYNTYKVDGLEADDIVTTLINRYREDFDTNLIYTPDSDLLVDIDKHTIVNRYKSKSGHSLVTMENFEEYCQNEFKCNIKYNAILLYKCTCGDKSDNVAGIKRFGPSGYNKLVVELDRMGIDWGNLRDSVYVEYILKKCKDYLGMDKVREALAGLALVKPVILSENEVSYPEKSSSSELREEAYMKFKMKSLVD